MSFFRASDLQALLGRTGGHDIKLASLGSGTKKGLVDSIDESLVQDGSSDLQGTTTTVRIETGSLVGLQVGSELIDLTDNIHYRVQRFGQVDDGALTVIHVARL